MRPDASQAAPRLAPLDRMRAVRALWVERTLLALPLPVTVPRRLFEAQARLLPRVTGVDVEWRRIAGVPCRVARPRDRHPRGRLLYVHGGGFVMGSPRTHAPLTDRLARDAGLEVVAPRYPLAPEAPFPAAVDACRAVARALPPGAHLGGDSAGGGLALAVLQDLLAAGRPPATVVLISPVARLDPARTPPRDHRELLLPEAFLRRCVAAYAPGVAPDDPRLSPIHGRYPGCPPVHLELSAGEILEGDGLALAALLRGHGAPVDVVRAPGVPHVFHLSAGASPAADAGVARLVRALAPVGPAAGRAP